MTLVYSLPQPSGALVWFHDLRRAMDLDGRMAEVMNTTRRQVGATHIALSVWAVAAGGRVRAWYRHGDATLLPGYVSLRTREFSWRAISFRAGKADGRFPFLRVRFQGGRWFPRALARYYELYPDAFVTRISKQGVWMPFAPISKVEGWQDFGFRIKEGTDETAWDDAHDILTFRYTEPMTWWMALKGEGPRTLERGVEEAKRLAAAGNRAGLAWESSAFEDEKGRIPGRVLDTPWCNGVVWSMNCAPGVPGAVTDFSNKWNAAYIEHQYGASRKAACDGEYIDSAEAYVTDELNFRRSHFASAGVHSATRLFAPRGHLQRHDRFQYVGVSA